MANKFIDQNGLRYFFSKLKRMFEKKADKSDLKPVATSGKYSDLEGKPEIDTTVAAGSANAVSGGAVYTAINNLPSGNNTLIVNITSSDDESLFADKTFQELINDYKANKNLYVNYSNGVAIAPLTLVDRNDSGEIEAMLFSTVQLYQQISFRCAMAGWTLESYSLASGEGLAEVAEAVENSIVLIDVTEDNNGNLSADKTFDELVSGIKSGARVVARYNDIDIPYVGASKMSSSTSDGGTSTETFSILYFQCELSSQSYMLTCEESGWQKVYLNFLHEQVDQGQNDSTQLDYIKNRTHWKETNGNETIFHKLSNEYLNIDTSPIQNSGNLISSGVMYNTIKELEAVKSAIPAVPSWALQETKPTYTAEEIGADAAGKATSEVAAHNTNTEAHNDMRLLIKDLTDRLNALADSDDTTLDQMSEIVAYIKNNKSLIDNITTTKSNVADIINNLTTNVTDKPLSAAQGVALKALIDAITVPTNLSQLSDDSTHRLVTDSEKNTWNSKLNLTATNNAIKTFFGGKTMVFSDTVPTVNDQNVITFVKRSG